MCLSTSQIGYSWIMRPSTLPPAYINFLNRHGGAPVHHYRAVQVLRMLQTGRKRTHYFFRNKKALEGVECYCLDTNGLVG